MSLLVGVKNKYASYLGVNKWASLEEGATSIRERWYRVYLQAIT